VATPKNIVGLYDELKAIDPNFNKESMLKSDMVKMMNMSKYWDKHAVATPYSFDLRKCNNEDCCGVIRTPMEVRDLVMQRTPTPRHDPLRVGHFKRREQLLSSANTNPNAMTDLTDLPSMKEDKNKEDTKERTNRDLLVSQAAGVRSWEFKKVKGFVVCYHCGKRRCIYSNNDKAYADALVAFQQKLESVSGRFSCGDLLFDDEHHLSKVIVQKKSLTCETIIEKGYYGNDGRLLKLKDICVHCGEIGKSVLGLKELRERSLTDGFNRFPICLQCLKCGKKLERSTRTQDVVQARKEKEQRAKNKK